MCVATFQRSWHVGLGWGGGTYIQLYGLHSSARTLGPPPLPQCVSAPLSIACITRRRPIGAGQLSVKGKSTPHDFICVIHLVRSEAILPKIALSHPGPDIPSASSADRQHGFNHHAQSSHGPAH
eukprot:2593903-Prymnesium_polylepis.3